MGAAGSRPGPSEGQETVANAGVAGGTLEQHCEMWEQAHGEPASRWTMSRAIKHLGWTRKKPSRQKYRLKGGDILKRRDGRPKQEGDT